MLREYNSGKNTQLNTKIHFPVGIAKEVRCHCKPRSAKVVQKIARQPAPCRWHRNVKTMAQNIVASYGIVPCLKVNVSKQLSHWTSTVSTHFFFPIISSLLTSVERLQPKIYNYFRMTFYIGNFERTAIVRAADSIKMSTRKLPKSIRIWRKRNPMTRNKWFSVLDISLNECILHTRAL